MSEEDDIMKINVIILGMYCIGKTAIYNRYIYDRFDCSCIPTIGTNCHIIDLNIHSKKIKLHLWDTAGQEKYNAVTSYYYKNKDAFIYAFSVNDRESFKEIEYRINETKKYTNIENAFTMIIGTKIDLKDGRVILKSEAIKKAQTYGMIYHEVSSLEDIGINEMFQYILAVLFKRKTKSID